MENFNLHHITRPSSLKDNAPLLILFHGYGSDENDLFSFAAELPEELFIISKVKEASAYNHLNFYCSHGTVDQVIPVDWARKAPKFLSALNIKNQFSEFPVGHGVAPQNFYELKDWLQHLI